MKLYSCKAIENLITRYLEKGGEVEEIEEGSLGYGFLILHGDKLKTAIVKEVLVTTWSSGHTVRLYNKMPKKYAKMIEEAAYE